MNEPTRGHVEFDPAMMGVRLAIVRPGHVLTWEQPGVEPRNEGYQETPDNFWLRLPEDDARALYEGLADYFGHAGHDARALRKDYEAERRRVDLLIDRAIPRGTSGG